MVTIYPLYGVLQRCQLILHNEKGPLSGASRRVRCDMPLEGDVVRVGRDADEEVGGRDRDLLGLPGAFQRHVVGLRGIALADVVVTVVRVVGALLLGRVPDQRVRAEVVAGFPDRRLTTD